MNFCGENFRGLLAFAVPTDAMPPNFTEKTFANSHKTVKFVKVFSLESFPLYGIFSEMVMVTFLDSSDKQLKKGVIGCRE